MHSRKFLLYKIISGEDLLHLSSPETKQFIRGYRSCIVNVDFITKIELMEKELYLLILKDKKKVSKSGYKLYGINWIFEFLIFLAWLIF